MAFRQHEELTEEQIRAFLKDAVAKVKEHPEEYEEYKKIFKEETGLTTRNFVAAYILKQAGGAIYRFNKFKDNGDEFRPRKRFESENSENTENREFKHERYQHIEIDSDVAATVFVGVGKNRRVYPKDIVGLFISVAGLEKERIGDIKVYANYSFVQLFKDDADKAINALNGYEYRGRKLSVSYSRQKGVESEGELAESANADAPAVTEVAESVAERPAAAEPTPAPVVSEEPKSETRSFSELSDEEILAMRAPRSSSTSDIQ
jgi:hypothetical protein